MLRSLLIAIALACPSPAAADVMRPLGGAMAHQWRAIGVVNREGASGPAACTGTLIAPDKVLTATHCAWGDGPHVFSLGGVGPLSRFEAPARQVHIHPEYTKAPDAMARFAVDHAVLHLSRPVPADIATPLSIAPYTPDRAAERPLAMVGFFRSRPASMAGRFDCHSSSGTTQTRLMIDCTVASGNSGSPVLRRGAENWEVIGIAVAKLGKKALVAPVLDWTLRAATEKGD